MNSPARGVPVDSFSFSLFRGTDFTCLKNSPVQFRKVAIKVSAADAQRRNPTAPFILFFKVPVFPVISPNDLLRGN